MKKELTIITLFLLITLNHAISFNATIDNNIIIKEYDNELTFTLSIQDADLGVYNVYTLSDVYINPSEPFTLTEGQDKTQTLTITPMKRLLKTNGPYTINYVINHREVEQYNKQLNIQVKSINDALNIKAQPINLDATAITIQIENPLNLQIDNLTMTFSSLLFQRTQTIDLNKPTHEITIPINTSDLKKLKGGAYILTTQFNTPNGDIAHTSNMYLSETSGVNTIEETEGIIIRSKTISKINTGNTIETVQIEIRKNLLTRFFTSFNIPPVTTIRNGLQVTYIWNKQVTPSSNYTIKATTNYIFPILLILIIYLSITYANKLFQAKIIVKKTATPIKTKNGEFALRVRLNIKAKRYLADVQIIDRVPKTVKIYNKFGMTPPDNINPEKRQLKWHIGEMNNGEERMFTYVVYSRVGYLGKFILPKAIARFKEDDQQHQAESNHLFFLTDQEKDKKD